MSRRHHAEFAEALSFQERRAHAHRERSRVNVRLRELAAVGGDGDEPGSEWRPERRHEVEHASTSGREWRHWKQPFWKRRTASRRERAVMERAVAS
ncbi:MAG: hypothetical protein JWL83_334 [Actinomycetia bacterium]|jgi:hypothetical protein|nr:hypothetical protein [Actinomycetes bacterium]